MKRNETLKSKLSGLQVQPKLKAAINVPAPSTVNIQGHEAYSLDKWSRLISMLTTLKVQDQFYKSASTQLTELKEVVNMCAKEDAILVAKAIIWARCVSDGMRTVSHVATVFLLPFLTSEVRGQLLNLWNKKAQKGGTIYRADDMSTIVEVLKLTGQKLPRKLVRQFASNLEKLDSYSILKYKKDMINLTNLVHPDPKKARTVEYNGEQVSVIDALMKGLSVSADTWEVAQSDAGQKVAMAVKEGKLSTTEAKELLDEAKNENWIALMEEGKLGILAAVRNIRNILKGSSAGSIKLLCALLSNGDLIRKGKVLPHQLDLAYKVVITEFSDSNSRSVLQALQKGYELAIPNLADAMTGNTCVIADVSGSMTSCYINKDGKTSGDVWGRMASPNSYIVTCYDQAMLISATLAKATNADIVQFDSSARRKGYSPNLGVFDLAESLKGQKGGATNLATAWQLINGKAYDRVIIISDNECNRQSQVQAYKDYLRTTADPYVYIIDLASYGTVPLASDKVNIYFGAGYQWMDDMLKGEISIADRFAEISKVEF